MKMSDKFVVVVDSTTDLPLEQIEKWRLNIIAYIYTVDDKEYYQDLLKPQQTPKEFYDDLRAGKQGRTTQITPQRYVEAWEPFLKEGKDILYMCLSSALSKSYEMSLLALEECKEKYPERKIISIDTKSASMGQGILAIAAAKARDEGKSLEEAGKILTELIPKSVHWIIADDLHHLRRGGRVSGFSAFAGSLLGIKPIIHVNDDGALIPVHKARGKAKAHEYVVERLMGTIEPLNQEIAIVHSDDEEAAYNVRDLIVAKLGKAEFIINNIGPVIGSHTGPGTIALIFFGKHRKPSV
jgi:DegV family protein with EDD domain